MVDEIGAFMHREPTAQRREHLEGLVDAHAHLDFSEFDGERSGVLRRAREAGVRALVIAGYSPSTFARAEALRSESIVVTAGLHPWALAEQPESADDDSLRALEALVSLPTSAGVGEIGLDAALARGGGITFARQARIAREGLAIAARAGKPLVLHVVGAHPAMHSLLDEAGPLPPRMVHAFTGSAELARAWVRRETFVSFGPAVLVARNHHAREAARVVPLEWLLVESDAPARPRRSSAEPSVPIEPAVLHEVVHTLAELRGEPPGRIAEATAANVCRLFPGLRVAGGAPIAPTRPRC